MIRSTRSVCPVCLKPLRALYETVNGETFLCKECPEHGEFRTVVWRGEPVMSSWERPKMPSQPLRATTRRQDGCPYDCGLCDGHRQHTCTAVLEITQRCNLMCPVCFAGSGKGAPPDMSREHISSLLDAVLKASGLCNLQFSGGEPTVRDDLPQLIRIAKEKGFPFVQVNSNGLRFASDAGYAQDLAHAGLDSVFLQFDGVDDAVYHSLRGKDLLAMKKKAVEALGAAHIGVVLVPTVVPGINESQLGAIIRFAIASSPIVRGVHFQPMSYFGRYPTSPESNQRITLPEIMSLLEEQTSGQIRIKDFVPPGCEHSLCSFHANYVIAENEKLQKIASQTGCGCKPKPASEGAKKAKDFVRRQWTAPKVDLPVSPPMDALERFIARTASHTLAVSAMAFQDCWTLDLERLQGCCIHEVAPDGRLIPFCAYNLTSMGGDSLHRGRYFVNTSA